MNNNQYFVIWISQVLPIPPQIELKGECLTLSTDYDESYLRDGPVHSELVVDSVNFLEAGLIFQTEDQDYCIHPTCKLERREEKNKSIKVPKR